MKRKSTITTFFIIAIVAITFCLLHKSPKSHDANVENISFAQGNDKKQVIHPFESDGKYVVLVPAGWDLEKLIMKDKDGNKKWTDVNVEDGKTYFCKDLNISGAKNATEIVFVKSKINTLFITTESGSIAKVNESGDKSYKEKGHIRAISADGKSITDAEMKHIKGRGNASWNAPQKPYNIKLKEKAKLLDLGEKVDEFCLLGSFSDMSALRNYISLKTASETSLAYTPSCSHVAVFINGNYNGVYLLTSKVSVGKENTLCELENNSGYLDDDKPHFTYAKKSTAQIKNAKKGSEDVSTSRNLLDSIYNDLTGPAPKLENIDIESFVDYYLIQEIFMNMDGGVHSFFAYHSTPATKLYAGPLWDMDNAMSKPYDFYYGGDLAQLLRTSAGEDNGTGFRGIMGELAHTPKFMDYVFKRYATVRDIASKHLFEEEYDSIYSLLRSDMKISRMRWNYTDTYDASCSRIQSFMRERIKALDAIFCRSYDDFNSVFIHINNDKGSNFEFKADKTVKVLNVNNLPINRTFNSNDFHTYTLKYWVDEENGKRIDSFANSREMVYLSTEWDNKSNKQSRTDKIKDRLRKIIPWM